LRNSLVLLILFAIAGTISLGSVGEAFAHMSADYDHQSIHALNESFLEKNTKLSEFTDEYLLPRQTITEKKLLEFYEKNEMIEDFGNGRLTEKFTSTGTAKVWHLGVVVHTEAEKAETIIVNTNYEIIKSYSEVFTPEDYDYL